MGQELQLPDTFKGQMPSSFRQYFNPEEQSLADGIGQSYGVVGYKGKVWSLRYRGQRHAILRPDDGTPSAHLDVIILGAAATKSKSYYPDFKDDGADRPTCSSIDGSVPDLDVKERQAQSCALCPRQVWKMQPNGRNGRECTDYKRLAVLILPPQTAKLFNGVPLLEPVFLRVPPDSLNSLAIAGETLQAQGWAFQTVITRITFDPSKAHPSMLFRPIQPLTEAELPAIVRLSKDPQVNRIIGGEAGVLGMKAVQQEMQQPAASGLSAAATSPASPPAPKPNGPTTPQSNGAATVAPSTAPLSTGLAPSTPAHVDTSLPHVASAPPVTPAQGTSAIDNGLAALAGIGPSGGANGASTEPTQLPTVLQTAAVADAGEAEPSDEELDAKIASMLAGK